MSFPVFSPRTRWVVLSTALLGLTAAAAITFFLRVPANDAALRKKVIETLESRLDAEVELGELDLDVFPRLRATGTGLIVRHEGRQDVPPLFSVEAFEIRADLAGLLRNHVAHVRLDGLVIAIPPDDESAERERREGGSDVVVDELVAADAKLVIVSRDPGRPPKTWAIHELRMETIGAHTAMPFNATLTNAVPPGEIATAGNFGPWHRTEPGRTPLDGRFTFEQADLGYFKGISGTLSAQGSYGGSLARIEVHGETTTPDFTVAVGGHPVPLETKYHAIVDGTNGNTRLERVDASFLDTRLVASGGVFEVEGAEGREVVLDVVMDEARLEDVLRLAVSSPQPPMTGALELNTKFVLPPGDRDVVEKLRLDGAFTIDGGRFTDPGVQSRINELSARARGRKTAEVKPQRAESDFSGRFQLADGTLKLAKLTFDVPGALVELDGRYALRPGTLDFAGNLYMDAKVSQTVSGYKSVLLKIVDPLFRKNGRTVVPLKISGTREMPEFGMDVKRVFTRAGR